MPRPKPPTPDVLQSEITALRHLLEERDRRYEERFTAQEKAVGTALQSAKEAFDQSKTTQERHNQASNEYRQQLKDQQATFPSRVEVDTRYNQLEQLLSSSVAQLREHIDSSLAQTRQFIESITTQLRELIDANTKALYDLRESRSQMSGRSEQSDRDQDRRFARMGLTLGATLTALQILIASILYFATHH